MKRAALAALLLACTASGSAVSRPATPVVLPARHAWRTWPVLPPASPRPAVITVPVVTAAPRPTPKDRQEIATIGGPATAGPRRQPDPVARVERKATPAPRQRPRNGLRGQASWFAAPAGTAAAGRSLRAFLGHDWRNDRVRVCGPVGCRVLVTNDWMGNPRRVIDLPAVEFPRICGKLSIGVCRVTVGRA